MGVVDEIHTNRRVGVDFLEEKKLSHNRHYLSSLSGSRNKVAFISILMKRAIIIPSLSEIPPKEWQ